jgi:hypothetical protein
MDTQEPRGRPKYVPDLNRRADGDYIQRFRGGFVIAGPFDGSRMLGATETEVGGIHHFLVTYPEEDGFSPADVYVEFNDQGNGCSGEDVTLTLEDDTLVVEYDPGVRATTGRISYADDADPLEDPGEPYRFPLRQVRVDLALTPELRRALLRELGALRDHGVRVRLPRF